MNKYDIMDETGKVSKWLGERGITVWESQDLSCPRPDQITPAGAERPHWAYRPVRVITDPKEVRLFRPHTVDPQSTWSETKAGLKAANKALPEGHNQSVPIGHMYTEYSIKRLTLESKEQREDGRPLFLSYRVGILSWTYLDEDCTCDGCKNFQKEKDNAPS